MFKGRFTKDGKGFKFSDFFLVRLNAYMKKNPGQPFELKPILAESKKQRGWFEGGICPLVAFYQEGMDHHEAEDVRKVREWLKTEFNSELVAIGDIVHKVAKSTKNELNSGFLERVVEYIIENYAPPMEALDPKRYKHWHDAIYPYGGPDNYIDYLVKINLLKNMDKDTEIKEERDQPNYNLADDDE